MRVADTPIGWATQRPSEATTEPKAPVRRFTPPLRPVLPTPPRSTVRCTEAYPPEWEGRPDDITLEQVRSLASPHPSPGRTRSAGQGPRRRGLLARLGLDGLFGR